MQLLSSADFQIPNQVNFIYFCCCSSVLSVTRFSAGDAYNVIPAEVNLAGTMRSLSEVTAGGGRLQKLRGAPPEATLAGESPPCTKCSLLAVRYHLNPSQKCPDAYFLAYLALIHSPSLRDNLTLRPN